jgi:type II secretory pathway pseudopilin PulG
VSAARVRRAAGREDGVAAVVSLGVLAVMMILGAVAVFQAIAALDTSNRDRRIKTAGQAAEAAIDAAIFALGRIDLQGTIDIDPLNPTQMPLPTCINVDPNALTDDFEAVDLPAGTLPSLDGRRYCPVVTEEAEGGATWSYTASEAARVSSGTCGEERVLTLDRTIVATGELNGVLRRVKVTLRAPVTFLSGAAVQSGSSTSPMTINGTSRVLGDVHSNHGIQTSSGTPLISGNATPGYGQSTSGFPLTVTGSRDAACERFVLPPVAPGDSRTDNDNALLAAQDSADQCLDALLGMTTVSCVKPLVGRTGDISYNAGDRTLTLTGNAKAVLTGDTYNLCSVTLTGQSTLVVPNSSPVTRLFIDDPTACSGVTGAGTITVDGTSRIVNCHLSTDPASFQLYAIGDDSTPTTQTLAGGGSLAATALGTVCGLALPAAGTPMVLYAPRSTLALRGATAISGQVVADLVWMNDSAAVQPVSSAINLGALGAGPLLPVYTPDEYVECTPMRLDAVAGNPTQGC